MGWTRASALDRALQCLGPAVLPREESGANAGSEWGKIAHAWKETGRVDVRPEYPELAPLFSQKLKVTQINKEDYWPAGGRHEVAIAINCLTPAVYSFSGTEAEIAEWKEQWPDHYLTGALDYVGEILDDPWVDDLKTGKADNPLKKLPRDRAQMWAYAMAVSFLTTAPQVHVSITWWPRLPLNKLPVVVYQSITREELWQWWLRLSERYKALVDLRAKPSLLLASLNTGPHCFWCPSKKHCPKMRDYYEQYE